MVSLGLSDRGTDKPPSLHPTLPSLRWIERRDQPAAVPCIGRAGTQPRPMFHKSPVTLAVRPSAGRALPHRCAGRHCSHGCRARLLAVMAGLVAGHGDVLPSAFRRAELEAQDAGRLAAIVSEALSLAAEDEKSRKTPPCGVTLHASLPKEAIQDLDGQPLLAKQRAILFRDGRWITNPFGGAELAWAEPVLQQMLEAHRGSSHEPKYKWLLDLFADVRSNTSRSKP